MRTQRHLVLLLLIAGTLLACRPQTDAAAPASSPTLSNADADSESAAQDEGRDQIVDLQKALVCGDGVFQAQSVEVQLARLQLDPVWYCDVDEGDAGQRIGRCQPNEPFSVLGARVLEIEFGPRMDFIGGGIAEQTGLSLSTRLQGDAAAIREALAAIWKRRFGADSGQLALSDDPKGAYAWVRPDYASPTVLLSCEIPSGAARPQLPAEWQPTPSPPIVSKAFEPGEVADIADEALLSSVLRCEADAWLAMDLPARRKAIEKATGQACTDRSTVNQQRIDCPILEDGSTLSTTTIGGHSALSLTLTDDGQMHASEIAVGVAPEVLKASVEAETQVPMEAYQDSVGRFLNRIDERYQFVIRGVSDDGPDEIPPTVLQCRMWENVELDFSLMPGS